MTAVFTKTLNVICHVASAANLLYPVFGDAIFRDTSPVGIMAHHLVRRECVYSLKRLSVRLVLLVQHQLLVHCYRLLGGRQVRFSHILAVAN
jgi:hypothetical protein